MLTPAPMHETITFARGQFGAFGVAGRVFVAALRNGVDYFRAHPEWWGHVLQGLPVEQIAIVRERFDARPPKIVLAYPRGAIETPTLAVVETNEVVDQPFVGDYLEQDDYEDIGLPDQHGMVELRGAVHRKTLRIHALATHPDVAHFLHLWALFVLQSHVDFFERVGLQGAAFDGAGEIAPDLRFVPVETWSFAQDWLVRGIVSQGLPIPEPQTHVYGALRPAGGAVDIGPEEDR